jgi:hypothetical protein
MISSEGIYNDVTAGQRGISETENGALQLAVECLVPDGSRITAFLYLVGKAGAINEKTVANLKAATRWDGVNIPWLIEAEWPAFQITVGAEEYQGKTKNKVQWLNPNNSTGGAEIVTGDMKSIVAKYGAMFRAVAGPQPVKAPPQSAPPTKGKTPPQAKKVDPSDQVECWNLFSGAYPDALREDLEAMWFGEIGKLVKGKDPGDFTPEDWGKVKVEFAKLAK